MDIGYTKEQNSFVMAKTFARPGSLLAGIGEGLSGGFEISLCGTSGDWNRRHRFPDP